MEDASGLDAAYRDSCMSYYEDLTEVSITPYVEEQRVKIVDHTCPFFNYTSQEQPEVLPTPSSSDILPFKCVSFDARRQAIEKQHSALWTQAEDDFLCALVDYLGNRQWQKISFEINRCFRTGRTNTYCNQHYNRVLKNYLKKGIWSDQEDARLVEALRNCGKNRWYEIAYAVGGRSDVQARYRAKKLCPAYFK